MGFLKDLIKNEGVKERGEGWECPHCGKFYMRFTKCCEHIDKKHGGK